LNRAEFTDRELKRLDEKRLTASEYRSGQLLAWVLRERGRYLCGPGLALEFGVYSGKSVNRIAKSLEQPVFGFDSFEGLPEDWDVGNAVIGKDRFDLEGRLPQVESNVVLVKGWFDETLPLFLRLFADPVRILHIDCDLYSSTKTVLSCLGDRIQTGTVVVFDELINYPRFHEGEWRALYEFVVERRVSFEWLPTFGGVRRDFADYVDMKTEQRDHGRDPEAALVVTSVAT
jgi:predicted O-methyltransferase YrrM